MTWILIAWMLATGPNSFATAIDVEFDTQEACQDAAEKLRKKHPWRDAICVPKGESVETE